MKDGFLFPGLAATLLCSMGIIIGGAYHAQFTYLGILICPEKLGIMDISAFKRFILTILTKWVDKNG